MGGLSLFRCPIPPPLNWFFLPVMHLFHRFHFHPHTHANSLKPLIIRWHLSLCDQLMWTHGCRLERDYLIFRSVVDGLYPYSSICPRCRVDTLCKVNDTLTQGRVHTGSCSINWGCCEVCAAWLPWVHFDNHCASNVTVNGLHRLSIEFLQAEQYYNDEGEAEEGDGERSCHHIKVPRSLLQNETREKSWNTW